jgi:hypothetical protein
MKFILFKILLLILAISVILTRITRKKKHKKVRKTKAKKSKTRDIAQECSTACKQMQDNYGQQCTNGLPFPGQRRMCYCFRIEGVRKTICPNAILSGAGK